MAARGPARLRAPRARGSAHIPVGTPDPIPPVPHNGAAAGANFSPSSMRVCRSRPSLLRESLATAPPASPLDGGVKPCALFWPFSRSPRRHPVFPPASLPPSGSASVCCPSGSMPGAAPCSAPCSSPPGRHGCVALLLGRALPAHSCALVPRALGGASSGGAPVRATMAPRRRRRRARLGGRPALRLFCCGPWWGPPLSSVPCGRSGNNRCLAAGRVA